MLYQQFAGDRGDEVLGDPARWTKANEKALIALRDALIEIGDTVYGQYEAQKKRDVKTAYQKMSAKERESLNRELAGINEAAAGDGQSTLKTLPQYR